MNLFMLDLLCQLTHFQSSVCIMRQLLEHFAVKTLFCLQQFTPSINIHLDFSLTFFVHSDLVFIGTACSVEQLTWCSSLLFCASTVIIACHAVFSNVSVKY